MTRKTASFLLLAALVAPGCLGMEKVAWQHETPEIKAAPLPAPIAPVKQVNANDPEQTLQALSAELERAEKEPIVQPVTAHVQPKP